MQRQEWALGSVQDERIGGCSDAAEHQNGTVKVELCSARSHRRETVATGDSRPWIGRCHGNRQVRRVVHFFFTAARWKKVHNTPFVSRILTVGY